MLTGAGISTDSGIPDFRGPKGVWTRNPEAEKRATLQHYMSDPQVRRKAWLDRLDHPAWAAEPNAGHRALVHLERRGKLDTLVTQNIDGLHQAAGSDPERVVEVHGTIREVVCMSCDERAPMQRALDRVRAGEDDPPCRTCGGILKSATISFGQNLVAGRHRGGPAPPPGGPTCCWPSARRCRSTRWPTWCRWPAWRAPASSSSTAARRRWTTWPTPSCGARSATLLPRLIGPDGLARTAPRSVGHHLCPRSPDVSTLSAMAALLEAARRRNPLPTGTAAVGAG